MFTPSKRPLATRGIRFSYSRLPYWSRPIIAGVATIASLVTIAVVVLLISVRVGITYQKRSPHVGFVFFWTACAVLCIIAARLLRIAVRVLRNKDIRPRSRLHMRNYEKKRR